MKRSGKRIVSACLLLALALTVTVGLLYALTADASAQNDLYLWVRLPIDADASVREIRLYGQDGRLAQTLRAENGEAVSGLLEPGTYFAVTELGCTEFSLCADASVRVLRGCGNARGKRLCLRAEEVGTVSVERLVSAAALTEDGWMDYALVGANTRLREVVRCTAAQEVLTCVFTGVPYGEYTLEENGVAQCRVTIDEETPEIAVSLP